MSTAQVTRRSLVKAAGVAAVAGAVAAGQAKAAESGDDWWAPDHWDDEADVIICGAGASGAFAAMTAVDEGLSAIVIEKSPYREGGDMACAGGGIHDCVNSDVEEWLTCYKRHAYAAAAPDDVMRTYMSEAVKMNEWIGDYGVHIDWNDFHGDGYFLPKDNLFGTVAGRDTVLGLDLFREVDDAVSAHGVDIRLATPAKRLIQNPKTREVVGVQAEGPDGETLYFKAHKGVILATGGFAHNDEMFQMYYQPGPKVLPMGTPYNTGDGITMALGVGADLWHLNNYCEYGAMSFVLPARAAGCAFIAEMRPEYIFVDYNGKRFMNESYIESHDRNHKPSFDYSCQSVFTHQANDPAAKLYNNRTSDFLHLPMFALFDQETYDKYNPITDILAARGYLFAHHELFPDDPLPIKWDDNQDAIDQGWMFKGDTLEELAANIKALRPRGDADDMVDGIDAEALKATVARYNEMCEKGEDTDFLRDPSTMIPIGDGPYYAIEVGWQTVITQGGPRRDGYSRTLDSFGEVIPRLYNTGSLGSYNAFDYNIGELIQAFTTGRLAAKDIATLDSWD